MNDWLMHSTAWGVVLRFTSFKGIVLPMIEGYALLKMSAFSFATEDGDEKA